MNISVYTDFLFFQLNSSNIHRFLNKIFHEFKVLKKVITTDMTLNNLTLRLQ